MGRKKAAKKPAPFGYRGKADDRHKVSSDFELWVDNWFYHHNVKHEIHPKVKNIGYADWKVGDRYVEFFGIRFTRAKEEKRKEEAYDKAGLKLWAIRPGDWIEKKLFELIYLVAKGKVFKK